MTPTNDREVFDLLAAGHFRAGDFGVVTSRGVEPVDSPDGHDREWVVRAVAHVGEMMHGRFQDVHGPGVTRSR